MFLPSRRTLPSAATVLVLSGAVVGSLVVGVAPAHAAPIATTYATGFVSPSGIAIDNSGNVYVADYANNDVTKISVVNGAQVYTPVGSGFTSPLGVAVDAAKTVYVADYLNNRVEKITADGVQSDVGSGFSYPAAVAVDASSVLYVADVDKIIKVASNGDKTAIASGFTNLKGLAIDAVGDMFVSDVNAGVGSVYRIDHASRAVQQIATGLLGPEGLAIDPAGNVLVADTYDNRVLRLTPGSAPTTVMSGVFSPIGVAVDSAGRILTGSIGFPATKTGTVVATAPTAIAAPAVPVKALGAVQLASNFAVAWISPTFANMATVDVRYRKSVSGAAMSGYLSLVSGTHSTSQNFVGASDTRYCFSTMSRTSSGTFSAWSSESCTAVPTDDRSLVRSSARAWVSSTDAGWLGATGSTATVKGSALTTAQVRAVKSISLLAWTCPTCGVVDVYVGTKKVGSTSLAKAGVAKRSLLTPIKLTSVLTGKVKIVVTSAGKRVKIDGIAIG